MQGARAGKYGNTTDSLIPPLTLRLSVCVGSGDEETGLGMGWGSLGWGRLGLGRGNKGSLRWVRVSLLGSVCLGWGSLVCRKEAAECAIK